jgi:large subunit ribosomal protein L14
MIQNSTVLKVIDNTGAKTALCLKVKKGYKSRYAFIGDSIVVSIKSIRVKNKETVKVKKGEIFSAIVVKINKNSSFFQGDYTFFYELPSIILLNKQDKIFGSRVFGFIPKTFRYTRYLKLISMANGVFL